MPQKLFREEKNCPHCGFPLPNPRGRTMIVHKHCYPAWYWNQHGDKLKEKRDRYYILQKEEIKPLRDAYRRMYQRQEKLEVMNHYGGHCVCCGEKELIFLCIDHINGGGMAHRKVTGGGGTAFYHWLKKNHYPSGFQTLCFNCNMAKAVLGQCVHQKSLDNKKEI